jgi:uncharacterized protein with GYD domain
MQHYIILGNLTEQGFREIKDAPKRDEDARRLLERLGGRMQLYYTMGEYDFVAIVDLPTEENMLRFLGEMSSLGYARTRTLKAWSDTEIARVLSKKP